MVAVLTVVPAEYRTKESTEEDDHEEEEKAAVDYSKYFGGFGDVIGRTAPDPPFEKTSGFDRPSGLMDFFPDGPVGLYGMPGGTFRGGLTTSPTVDVSSDLGLPFQSNGSGFVENIKFQSFFDTSSSASERDIRPHSFSPRLRSKSPHSGGFFSPNFAYLKRGVDREVDYQRKEGSVAGSRKSADRKKSRQGSGELDGFDFSEFDFDESSEQDSTEQSSEEHQNANNEREDSTENTSNELNPVTPYSVVNHYHRPSSHGPSPSENVPKNPLTRPYNPREVDNPPEQSLPTKRKPGRFESLPSYYSTGQFTASPAITPLSNLYYRPLVYNSPANLNGYTRAQYPLVRANIQTVPLYKPVLPKSGGIPHISRNLNLHYRPKPLFTPTPRDVYLDYSKNTPLAKRRVYPISVLPRRSYPHIDRGPGAARRVQSPAVSAYKQKKFCKKAHKKMNSREFPKFEQQQMICYTCTDKAKNSTYEECRYGSEPDDDGSFYERIAETRSTKTVLPSTPVHARHERSVGKSNEKIQTSSSKHVWVVNRNRREYDDDDDGGDSDEQSRDDDRYDVDHSPFSSEEGDDWSREDDEYSFEEDDSEEESDIEREFQSPKTSDDGSCREVIKRGLTCMVCKNSKTGSSSEQCSYSSDPDDNKYEYSSQSSYGSGRSPSIDRNKRLDTIDSPQERGFHQNPLPEKRQNRLANLKDENRRNIDLTTRTFKINEGQLNSDGGRNSVKLQGEQLKVDAASEVGLPGLVEPNSSIKGLLGKTNNSKNQNKRGRHMRRGFVRADKTDSPITDAGSGNNNNPTQKTSSYRLFPEVKKTHPYNGESLKLRPKVVQKNKNKDANTELYTKYLDTPAKNSGRMEIELKQTDKAKPITGYAARMLPRNDFDEDDSEEELIQNIDKFKHKDRSDCTKLMRGHLTCFRCLGLDGMRHEECLFVNSTDPASSSHPEDEHLQRQIVKDLIRGR